MSPERTAILQSVPRRWTGDIEISTRSALFARALDYTLDVFRRTQRALTSNSRIDLDYRLLSIIEVGVAHDVYVCMKKYLFSREWLQTDCEEEES